MLQELKRDILSGKMPIGEGITRALPLFKGKLADHKVAYLVAEYQGYQTNALDWYKHQSKEFPNYRVVPGTLKMMMIEDGSLADVKHSLAERDQFFIAAPIAWVEEACGLGLDPTMIEMSEMGRAPQGIIVCVTAKSNAQKLLEIVKQSLLSFLDEADNL
jgi:hypothetical protein